jgi:hypothetical protein
MTAPCSVCHGNGYVGEGLNVSGCPKCDSSGESGQAREYVLSQARELICNDRARTHGDAGVNLTRIANFWGEFLDVGISASEAAKMMALLKIARDMSNPDNDDNMIDAIGYLALAYEQRKEGR